jgi:hypothetical protein
MIFAYLCLMLTLCAMSYVATRKPIPPAAMRGATHAAIFRAVAAIALSVAFNWWFFFKN